MIHGATTTVAAGICFTSDFELPSTCSLYSLQLPNPFFGDAPVLGPLVGAGVTLVLWWQQISYILRVVMVVVCCLSSFRYQVFVQVERILKR